MHDNIDIIAKTIETSKKALWYVVLFSAAANILMLVLPIYSLQVLDRVISSGSMETLTMLSLVAIFLFIIFGLFQIARTATLAKLGQWIDRTTSAHVLQATLSTSAIRPGMSGSQNMRDLTTLKTFLSGQGLTAIMDAPWSIVYLFVIFMIQFELFIITFIGCIVLLLVALLNEKAVKGKLAEANKNLILSMNRLETSARNSEVIEAMGMSDNVIERWQQENEKVLEVHDVAGSRAGLITSFAKSFRMILQIGVMGGGAYFVTINELTTGGLIACSIIAGRALAPFEMAIAAWGNITATKEAYERLKKAMQTAPKRKETIELPTPIGNLTVEKLVYAIAGSNKAIIQGIGFQLAAGDILGVIGPSASGKSTLAKLLVGVYPPMGGHVRLDGADVYTWDRKDFGKHVGYLPQDVELFEGTVKENIGRMNSKALDEDVINAAKLAGAHDLILHLPLGYETPIGVGGTNLSAGQRQRIGLARALFGDPKLLVLDEPNSNLDDVGENALMQALKKAKELKITTIIIAHRPTVLSAVDKIMVMKDGKIADFGNANEILAKYMNKQAPAAVKGANAQQIAQATAAQKAAAKQNSPAAVGKKQANNQPANQDNTTQGDSK